MAQLAARVVQANDGKIERLPDAVQAKEAWKLKACHVLTLNEQQLRCVFSFSLTFVYIFFVYVHAFRVYDSHRHLSCSEVVVIDPHAPHLFLQSQANANAVSV